MPVLPQLSGRETVQAFESLGWIGKLHANCWKTGWDCAKCKLKGCVKCYRLFGQ